MGPKDKCNLKFEMPGRTEVRLVMMVKMDAVELVRIPSQMRASFHMGHTSPKAGWQEGDQHTNQWENTNRTFQARILHRIM